MLRDGVSERDTVLRHGVTLHGRQTVRSLRLVTASHAVTPLPVFRSLRVFSKTVLFGHTGGEKNFATPPSTLSPFHCSAAFLLRLVRVFRVSPSLSGHPNLL